MSNNHYTSPRDYISRGYRSKRNIKTKSHFEMGIGYSIPAGMDKAEFKRQYAEWEKKLQNSGFIDIEYRSPSHSGHFNPFFRENGSTATFMRLYDPAKEEYYALARSFDAYMSEYPYPNSRCNRWAVIFRGNVLMYKLLWYLHIEGVPYRAVAKAFSGVQSKWCRNLKPIPAKLIQPRSVFWAHDHTHKILDVFWNWAKEQGYSDPRHPDDAKRTDTCPDGTPK